MPKIDPATAPTGSGTRYPAPFDAPCKLRTWRRVGDAAGLTQFGVNVVRLPPGTWSSQRHWHSHEDEFVYVLEGDVVLVTDAGEEPMTAGECAGFKAGERDGHCLQNRSSTDAVLLVVGSRNDDDHGEYPDIDLLFTAGRYSGKGGFTRKDGTPHDVGGPQAPVSSAPKEEEDGTLALSAAVWELVEPLVAPGLVEALRVRAGGRVEVRLARDPSREEEEALDVALRNALATLQAEARQRR